MSLILSYIVVQLEPLLWPYWPRRQDESLVNHALVTSARRCMDIFVHQCDWQRHRFT